MHQPENYCGPPHPLHGGAVPFPVREHCQHRRWSPLAGGRRELVAFANASPNVDNP